MSVEKASGPIPYTQGLKGRDVMLFKISQVFIDEHFPYVDHLAKQAWMSLVQKHWGHFECNRILWHMWKDNERRKLENDGTWPGAGGQGPLLSPGSLLGPGCPWAQGRL